MLHILEIVYMYNWSHNTTPRNEAELKFPGTLDISILEASKSVMWFALHGISSWWWNFSGSTYNYDNVPAQETCYTVACEKGRAVLAHSCGITVHPHFHGFFSQRWKALFLFADNIYKSLHCGIPLSRWNSTHDNVIACNTTLLTEVCSFFI